MESIPKVQYKYLNGIGVICWLNNIVRWRLEKSSVVNDNPQLSYHFIFAKNYFV